MPALNHERIKLSNQSPGFARSNDRSCLPDYP